jgi:spore coat polysaccharide biosynthesis predicted glycosyltransferase SpsG/RimJ/RimL family protein N-acetyltransferase
MSRRALIHCNAGVDYGMGHAMRSVGIAQAALQEGWTVTIGGDLSASARAVLARLLPSVTVEGSIGPDPAAWLVEATDRLAPDVLHIDSYWLDARSIPDRPRLVSNMQDRSYGVRPADLSIDGNHGAEGWFVEGDRQAACIVGAPGAVIRRQVRDQRERAVVRNPIPRLLIVIGGTDPARLTTRCLRAVIDVATPIDVTVICREDQMGEARRLGAASRHHVDVRGFVEDLPALAAAHDLIVSASGTSVWDFACMGIPMALICAADNQRAGYLAMVDAGLAIGLGEAPYADLPSRVRAIQDLLFDTAALGALRGRLMALVDGHGAWRIVASWSQLIDLPPAARRTPLLRARRATRSDARVLFDWRNDPQTRAASRSSGTLDWGGHVRWVEGTVEQPARQLLIVEDDIGRPVGTVRWDRRDDGWEVSITTAPAERGRGLGREILAAGEEALADARPGRLIATVHRDNAASRHLFARAGYLPHLPANADGFEAFAKWRFAV